jgi:histidinol-phosphatase (PHP family)
MKYDYHIHTEDSYDSRIKAEELIRKAIELKYDEIAITEHLDLLAQELSVFGLPSLKKYQARIAALQRQYPQIKILTGSK